MPAHTFSFLSVKAYASFTSVALATGLCVATSSFAATFGTYDARALAMGGATIAAGNTDHAHFYNPALLSFENEDEDLSKNSRFILPGFVALLSDVSETASDVIADDLAEDVTTSIDAYNASPNDAIAQQQAQSLINDFDEAADDLREQDVEFEGFVGLSVSEPANREGGSFYFGARGLVFAQADISDEDALLLDRYVDVLSVIVAGGTPSAADADLFDGANLRDPRDVLTSQAQVASLEIREWGIALSKEFPIWGVPVALGITPKFMHVNVYREDLRFRDDVPSYQENQQSELTMNMDVGIAAEFFEHYRIGFAAKDLIEKTFESPSGLAVELNPRVRLGLAFVNDKFTVGWDIDVAKNKPIATEPETQETALGVEYRPIKNLDVRLGFREDFAGERGSIMSAGVRYQFSRFVIETSYASGSELDGLAIQMGWMF